MKKLLALVLAMVMTLGLATVGASAAAYTDAADIDFTEAVDVMSALKVFDGQNGAFNPSGVLTREQGAKIIAYMILGKTAADSLTTAKSSFADVAPERWSAGSIEYCVSTKIVGGAGKDANGNDVFNPEEELTGYAFAKMCLVALGYNPNYENFVGGDWAINVAKVAADAGLDKDLASLVMSKGITREQAAQMALNTEKATMVQYSTPINVKGGDGMEVTVNASRSNVGNGTYNYRYTGAAANSNTVDANFTQFAERYNQSTKVYLYDRTDDMGRPADVWQLGNSTIGKYASAPTLTYTGAVKGGTLYNDLGGSNLSWSDFTTSGQSVINSDGASVYTAGDAVEGAGAKTLDQVIVSGNQDTIIGTGAGVKTEVYYKATVPYLYIYETRTYLAKALSAYNTSSNKLTVGLDDTAKAGLLTEINGVDFPVVQGAAKDEYFYVTLANSTGTKAGTNLLTVEKVPASAFVNNVTVSAKTTSSITAGGTNYTLAKQFANNSGVGAVDNVTLGNTGYDLILDTYGNVLSASLHSSDTQNVEKYLWVKNAGPAGLSYQAEVIKMDGTTATVTVNKTKANASASAQTITTLGDVTQNASGASGNLIKGAFYTYSTNDDGSYTLTYAKTYYQANTAVVKGQANQFQSVAVNAGVLGSKTAFVAGPTGSLSAYVGIANFPGAAASATTAVYFVGAGSHTGTIPVLYTSNNADSSKTSKYVYLFAGGSGSAKDGGTDYYTFNAFMDGALTSEAVAATTSNTGLFKVSYNSKDRLVNTTGADGTRVYKVGGSDTLTATAGGFADTNNNHSIATTGKNGVGAVYVAGGNVTIAASGNAYVYALSSDAEFYYIDAANRADSCLKTSAEVNAESMVQTAPFDYRVVLVSVSSSDTAIKQVWIIKGE